jgi:F0F1-type ATP synthase membrane subunit b/b'
MFGLSTIVAEALMVVAVGLLLIVSVFAGIQYFELKSLEAKYESLQTKNAACEAESAQRGTALDTQTKAVQKAKAEGDKALEDAKREGADAIAKAKASAKAQGYAKAQLEMARSKPTGDLCLAAQRENAEFLKGRQ